jgi:hypothetical protein
MCGEESIDLLTKELERERDKYQFLTYTYASVWNVMHRLGKGQKN